MTNRDVPGVLALMNYYVEHTNANFYLTPLTLGEMQSDFDTTHERYPWFVAEQAKNRGGDKSESGQIVAFAKAAPWKQRAAYQWAAEVTVYVQHGQHRQGIGRHLYSRLIDTARSQGYRVLLAGLVGENRASILFHESMGFSRIGTLIDIGYKHEQWTSVSYWMLRLGDHAPPSPICPVHEVVDNVLDASSS